MIPVELTPEVAAAVRQMRDRGRQAPRCHGGVIRSAVGGMVAELVPGGERIVLRGRDGRAVIIEE